MNTIHIDVQRAIDDGPEEPDIRRCIESVLKEESITDEVELTVRIVDEAEITSLNQTYRDKAASTNILSFPFNVPVGLDLSEVMPVRLLGDLIIAADVVKREAETQGKTLAAHWAHLLVHGTLHLLGHDHQDDKEAENMEQKEIFILNLLGYKNPYGVEQST